MHCAKAEQLFIFSNLLWALGKLPINSRKNFQVRITALFAAKEANAGGEGATVEIAECKELR